MNVKQLISKLKKMPPNAEVFTACHDNGEFETSGYTTEVNLLIKADYTPIQGEVPIDHMPDQWVTIR